MSALRERVVGAGELDIRVPSFIDMGCSGCGACGGPHVLACEVYVKAGQTVAAGQPLIALETNKAIADVLAPCAGVVASLHLAAGDEVSEGQLIVLLRRTG